MESTIVIKIGSSSLTNKESRLDVVQLRSHVESIVHLLKKGYKVVLVTSGAVAAGFTTVGFKQRPQLIEQKQAAAAVGQSLLMQAYMEHFATHGYVAGQLLLTRSDFADAGRFTNVSRTLTELLKRGVIPIVNENDSTAVEELTFGDNDKLSALVSGIVHADMLCLFTDVNGVYDENPLTNVDAKKYHFLPNVPESFMKRMDESTSSVGTGGMRSKLQAAQTAVELGVNCFIGTGKGLEKFTDILLGKGDGTYIGSFNNKSMSRTKQYILYHAKPSGTILIDQGAATALLNQQKSLLPAGVLAVNGVFSAGDIVNVIEGENRFIGKGKVNFTDEELRLIKGKKSADAFHLTKRLKKVVIHRDFWIAMEGEKE